MRTVRLWTSASACLLAASAIGAEPQLTNKLTLGMSLSNVTDPATVARTRLFLSADGGKTWTVAQEIRLDTPAKEPIRFRLTLERDGTYAIYPCTSFRDGRVEVEPKPGAMPPTAVLLAVDTLAPAVNRFDATLSGRAAAKAVVRVTWSVSDAHLGDEPVTVEASTDGGAHFTAIHHGAADGGTELTVPVTPDTKELHLRLAIMDRAGNATVSPARVLTMQGIAPTPAAPIAAPAPAATVPTAPVAATPTTSAPAPSATPTPVITAPTTAPTPVATNAPSPTPPATPTATTPAPAPEPATPSDPLVELAKAAKNLPTLEAVGATAPKPLPTTPIPPAVPSAVPAVAKAPTPAPALVPASPQPVAVPAAPVTNEATVTKAVTKAAEPVVAPPSKPEKPEPTPVVKPATPIAAQPPAAPLPLAAAKVPKAPKIPEAPKAPSPPPTNDGTRPAPTALNGNYLSTATAQQILGNARDLVRLGNTDDACDLYEQLRPSALAKTALLEEVQLLNRNARPHDAQMIAASASIEQVSDALRLEHGKALVAIDRPADAQRVLSGVRGNAQESRPALLLIARSALALGQTDDARKTLEFLARGSDAQAVAARELLQRLDNR